MAIRNQVRCNLGRTIEHVGEFMWGVSYRVDRRWGLGGNCISQSRPCGTAAEAGCRTDPANVGLVSGREFALGIQTSSDPLPQAAAALVLLYYSGAQSVRIS